MSLFRRRDVELSGAEPSEVHLLPSRPLSEFPEWRDAAGRAALLRIAGHALTIRVEFENPSLSIGPKGSHGLKRKAEKALKEQLGSEYSVERITISGVAVSIEVFASTTFSRTRSLISPRRAPWPVLVDRAVEALRRVFVEELGGEAAGLARASWTPGPGVLSEGMAPSDDAPAAAIQETIREQGDVKMRLQVLRLTIVIVALAMAGLGLVLALVNHTAFWPAYLGVYGFLGLILVPLLSARINSVRDQIAELKERLELRGLLDQEERRAFRLFQLHNLELKRYYDQALSQRRYIFGLGVFCILLGAGIAITAVALISGASTSEEKLLISGMGAAGAILSNFVAIVYLRMFRDTVGSMNVFHTRLVATHHLLFGNLLAARIGDGKLRDETLGEMAQAVARTDLFAAGSDEVPAAPAKTPGKGVPEI